MQLWCIARIAFPYLPKLNVNSVTKASYYYNLIYLMSHFFLFTTLTK